MTQTKNSTCDTNVTNESNQQTNVTLSGLLVLITLLAFAMRALRIDWQPLWWDEGYSVFFATEPLSRMLLLTASDIHPPLYYALLHLWIEFLNDAQPAIVRIFSIGVGTIAVPLLGAVVSRLTSRNSIAITTAALLLAVNPMHIYYSQEIRMYSLATTLGLASTLALVIWVNGTRNGRTSYAWIAAYTVLAALLLHTLYYAAILVTVQLTWALWMSHDSRIHRRQLLIGAVTILLLSLPWLWFTTPKLADYVANKVLSDQDTSLGLAEYIVRHFVVFAGGHVQLPKVTRYVALIAIGIAFIPFAMAMRKKDGSPRSSASDIGRREAAILLIVSVIGALLFGFIINLKFPFFPEGGERLLLFTMPYLLALVALGVAFSRLAKPLGFILVLPLLVVSIVGITSYYRTPRYTEFDYRPIVAEVEQRGTDKDTVLAIFPWQVGYWRSYGQRNEVGDLLLPQPEAVGQEIVVWDDALRSRIDSALTTGTLWFPEPLALGSTLPLEVEEYLNQHALNVDNKWQSVATRLTAWCERSPLGVLQPVQANFGTQTLVGSRVSPQNTASDNSVLDLAVQWQSSPHERGDQVAIKLVDSHGRVWAQRDYQPPGRFSNQDATNTNELVDNFGLQIPLGIPPDLYTVELSILDEYDSPYVPKTDDTGAQGHSVILQEISVTAPVDAVSPLRVPVDHAADSYNQDSEFKILGVSGIGKEPSVLAGAELDMQFVLQNLSRSPKQFAISASLVGKDGASVASWEGWPLPDYPTHQWPQGAITRVPVTLQATAVTPTGAYDLLVGLIELSESVRYPVQKLTEVTVISRIGRYEVVDSATPLPAPVQFGTHVRLYGYEAKLDGDEIQLALDWEVLQPLLPQHNIFVHILDNGGNLVAQQDGPPSTETGPAPTGSWRTGEYVTTKHRIRLPVKFDAAIPSDHFLDQFVASVGLYYPESGVRLPTFHDGESTGDSAELPLYLSN